MPQISKETEKRPKNKNQSKADIFMPARGSAHHDLTAVSIANHPMNEATAIVEAVISSQA